jgi:glycerol-3-phosphate dehydrogenase
MSVKKSAEEYVLEATRHARALAQTLTEARRAGTEMHVQVDVTKVRNQGDIVSVIIQPVTFGPDT